jgi:hypothetical protein
MKLQTIFALESQDLMLNEIIKEKRREIISKVK